MKNLSYNKITTSEELLILVKKLAKTISINESHLDIVTHPEGDTLPSIAIGEVSIYYMKPDSVLPLGSWCVDVNKVIYNDGMPYGDVVGLYCGTSMCEALSKAVHYIVDIRVAACLEDWAMGIDEESMKFRGDAGDDYTKFARTPDDLI